MSIATGPLNPQVAVPGERAPASNPGIRWELWCGALGISCSTFGLEWDIAWHYSIGRDTFWTPAHVLIYFSGFLASLVCSYLIFVTTFGSSPAMRANSVSVLGFRAPLGCFLAAWGGLAMLVALPFDNWWHAAYGVDVHLITPPHMVLFGGVILIGLGFLLLVVSAMNRAEARGAANYQALRRLFLYLGAVIVYEHMLGVTQLAERTWLHGAGPYKAMALAVSALFPLISRVSRYRWAATWAASLYMVVRMATILIFPLFPATPKLGPVLNPITHFQPLQFPILIILPAMALDLLWRRTARLPLWLTGAASGLVFSAVLFPAEWFFADFMGTRGAANRFFGGIYFPYGASMEDRLPHYARVQSGSTLLHGMLVATAIAIVGSWVGMLVGRWMRSVQR
jgi:hypothetical protein